MRAQRAAVFWLPLREALPAGVIKLISMRVESGACANL
jgi:hypothetical protein